MQTSNELPMLSRHCSTIHALMVISCSSIFAYTCNLHGKCKVKGKVVDIRVSQITWSGGRKICILLNFETRCRCKNEGQFCSYVGITSILDMKWHETSAMARAFSSLAQSLWNSRNWTHARTNERVCNTGYESLFWMGFSANFSRF